MAGRGPAQPGVCTAPSLPCSHGVMDRALMHADCVYRWPAFRARGHICRTHVASNTAFRGFGGPQVHGFGVYAISPNLENNVF